MKIEQLQKELQQSMKDKNKIRKNVIADILTRAKNIAIKEGTKDDITEDIVNTAILQSKKICQGLIDTCPSHRTDLMKNYVDCMGYIDELAPKMMTEQEIRMSVSYIINTSNVEITKGAIMKAIMPKLKGKADGKLIIKVVTDILKGE